MKGFALPFAQFELRGDAFDVFFDEDADCRMVGTLVGAEHVR